MGYVIFLLVVLLAYPVPFLYCWWIGKKENDTFYKKSAFLPIVNVLMIITYHTTEE